MNIITLKGITKSFRDGENRTNQVLREVNLSIEAGEFVAIKGASGSGKTTLLSILGALIPADSGSYTLGSEDMRASQTNLCQLRNGKIGFMFQDARLLPQLTALQNILLPTLAYQAKPTADQEAYAQELMKLTHIEGVAGQVPHTLSGGEASRVALCRALLMKPLLLLADEPTGQLDHENALRVAHLLKKINQTLHTTIVMVTHSEEIAAIASRTLTLTNGILR